MKVFITRKIPDIAVELLIQNGIDVVVYGKDKPISKNELIKYSKDADGIIALLTDNFDATVINELKNCKIIANYAVGYNNIDLISAKRKNIIITNTPDILTDATADLTIALVLCCARNIIAGHQFVSKNNFTGWKPELLLGVELKGKTFGIIGAGRIGTAVAIRAKAFGTNIVYFSKTQNLGLEKSSGAKKVSLTQLLKNSDIISVHLPLTKETYHLLDKEKLNLMKEKVIFINTARGEIADEKELINMLKAGKIFSAGFDVYENEPELNKELFKLPNVVLLPHLGSATFEARSGMAKLAAMNIINVLKGKKPVTIVD
ncbi:MAG: D-glycerate dehydrogenase [Ignavibacteriales bacterium]|nr:D-glycerate dehydrogenase [Ignavibacteriales bacterium]